MASRVKFNQWGFYTLALIGSIAPIVIATTSPLLMWRDPIYIGAGFAGILGLSLLFLQPLIIGGFLRHRNAMRLRRIHRAIGGAIVILVLLHVGGLWITSPPDVIDALMFRSPTRFSIWGVIAMWAVFGAGCMALLRPKIRPRIWTRLHKILTVLIVVTSIAHVMLIEGTMGTLSKTVLCVLLAIATYNVVRSTPKGS